MTDGLVGRLWALGAPGGRPRRFAPLVGLLVAAVVLAVLTMQAPSSGLPLDPRSTDPSGTRALVLILEEVGADVSIVPADDTDGLDTLLVLVDNLDDETAEDVAGFVDAGGVALVTDFGGALAPRLRPAGNAGVGFFDTPLRRECDVAAFAAAETVRVYQSAMFVVPQGADGCFRQGNLAWLVVQQVGAGTMVTTGGPSFLTNGNIGAADNAQLVAAVLAPRPGSRVGIVDPDFRLPSAGEGESLTDLIPSGWKGAFLQLLIAFGLVVLWRARRLGKPVREPQLVRLAGSELVVAVGNLFQRTGARARAAELLRADVRRTLSQRLGTPEHAPSEQLADAAAARAGTDRETVAKVLAGPDPTSDAELVAFAQSAEAVRSSVLAPVLEMSGDTRVS